MQIIGRPASGTLFQRWLETCVRGFSTPHRCKCVCVFFGLVLANKSFSIDWCGSLLNGCAGTSKSRRWNRFFFSSRSVFLYFVGNFHLHTFSLFTKWTNKQLHSIVSKSLQEYLDIYIHWRQHSEIEVRKKTRAIRNNDLERKATREKEKEQKKNLRDNWYIHHWVEVTWQVFCMIHSHKGDASVQP